MADQPSRQGEKHRMTQLQNAAFLRALPRQPTAYTALRMMRRAGRYLPEYKQIRRRAGDFLDVCVP